MAQASSLGSQPDRPPLNGRNVGEMPAFLFALAGNADKIARDSAGPSRNGIVRIFRVAGATFVTYVCSSLDDPFCEPPRR